MSELPQLVIEATTLQDILIARATHNTHSREGDYFVLRHRFMKNPLTKAHLPDFVQRHTSLEAFWPFIQRKFPTYKERREFRKTGVG